MESGRPIFESIVCDYQNVDFGKVDAAVLEKVLDVLERGIFAPGSLE